MTPGAPPGPDGPTSDAGTDSAEQPGAAEPSAHVFDDASLRTYELVIAPADLAVLEATALQEMYVPATLRFEGLELGPIGVRYKGGHGTLRACFRDGQRICDKLSIKLRFDEYRPEQRFYGLKRLNFHSMKQDRSLLRDRLAYSLFRDLGLPASRAVHARLVINGEYAGLFALVEQVDGRFTRRVFADGGKGNLYKDAWPGRTDAGFYLQRLETNEDENPSVDRFVRFSQALAAATDQNFASVLAQWTDVDRLLQVMAVDRLIEHWDGPVMFYCGSGTSCGNHNFYWYEESASDRVWLIPWDMDNTLRPDTLRATYNLPEWDVGTPVCDIATIWNGANRVRTASCDGLLHRLGTVTRDSYRAAVQALLDGPAQIAAIEEKLSRWEEQIAAAVADDGNGPTVAEWQTALGELRSHLPGLRDHLATRAAAPL